MSWLLVLFFACDDPSVLGEAGPFDTGAPTDTGEPDDPADPLETPDTDAPPPSQDPEPPLPPADTGYQPTDPALLQRGQAWVQQNRPFVSGLTPHIEAPPASEVDRYYDAFHATAAHLWEDALPSREAGWSAAGNPDHRWVAWVHASGISHENQQVIGGLAPNPPGRIGYQVGDEPRDWDDVADIDAGIGIVRAADPEALVIINLGTPDAPLGMPDFADFADHFASDPDVDVLSYDLYSTGYGEYERLEIIRAAALTHDKPYWRYLRSFDDLGETDWPHESDLRWDAFVGLVYGYTGLSWFIYEIPAYTNMHTAFFDGAGSWTHTPNARFDIAAELNAQVEQYTRVVSQLTSTDVAFIPATPLYTPAETHSWSPGMGGDPHLVGIQPVNQGFLEVQDTLVGFFEDNQGETYVMLQNPHRESADWPVFLQDDADFRLSFDFAGSSTDSTRLRRFDPLTGQVVDLPLDPTGPTTAALEITLPAGDVVLFKYATGNAFAIQP